MSLMDSYGRRIGKLRVSVTDRCNLRCVYCMPAEGLTWLPSAEILSYEEIARLTAVFAGMGVSGVRLTGGEPLLRADLPRLVKMLYAIDGIDDLSLTTNGIGLRGQVAALAQAGLRRVNVSLDSLDPKRFHELSRRDALPRVLEGLDAALETLPGPIKVNVVSMRGHTEQEVVAFARLARQRGLTVRFIEFMPLDADQNWHRDQVLTGAEVRKIIAEHFPIEPVDQGDSHAPSQDWRFTDAPGGLGFIDSVSAPFCESCDRVRLTADGRLRTCLFSVGETDLRGPLRDGASDGQLAAIIQAAVWHKQPGHRIDEPDFVRASRSMSQIGG
jgi:cyclic pyranopterin phosphate synthase